MSFNYTIRTLNGSSFDVQTHISSDLILTGEQVIEKAGKYPAEEYLLFHVQEGGMLEEINLRETVDISCNEETFFVFNNDRVHYLELNGRRYPWGDNTINEAALRLIGNIPENHSLWLEQRSDADSKISDKIDLDTAGLEKIYSKEQEWKLKVNGVTIVSKTQCILVSDALTEAGFNPSDSWILILRVKGQPKQEVEITDNIDLSQPGIEKLRVVQKEINNGEKGTITRTEFTLLEKDVDYLNSSGISYETILEGNNRWLILLDWQLPQGYNHEKTDIAISIPSGYPAALIDMFYCHPHLTMKSGAAIPTTTARVQVEEKSYQRWSRHLGGSSPWNPSTDSVMTHLALVEESLLREVEK